MAESLYIGRLFGIRIELHWVSVLFLLFAALVSFYFLAIWLMVLACVILHELAHSITAKRNGVKVKRITIVLPLGGGSVIDTSGLDPNVYFNITIAGPLMSMFLGFLFGIFAVIAPVGIIRNFLQIGFVINMLLGIFNFIPWFPLDGGRMLSSYLQKSRPFLKATELTVKISNIITLISVILTFVIVFALMPNESVLYKEFFVMIDLFFAIFIYSGAQEELRFSYLKDYASKIKIRHAISRGFTLAKPNEKIEALYSKILKTHSHIIIYQDGDKIKVVSNLPNYIYKGGFYKGYGEKEILVKDLKAFEIPKVNYNTTLDKALDLMQSNGEGVVAAVENNRIIGLLLEQHVNSIIALYMHKTNKARNKNTKT
ncbi:MAG: M50 family metallopeptidase [Candidatus Micrarchaeia archaeon]